MFNKGSQPTVMILVVESAGGRIAPILIPIQQKSACVYGP